MVADEYEEDKENEIMNVDWIEEYEDEEKYYTMFYPEKTSEIKVNMLYVNKTNELEKIKEENANLKKAVGNLAVDNEILKTAVDVLKKINDWKS